MAKVELKQPIVDEIKASLEGAQGVVVVDYRGLTVEQDTQLRKQLREAIANIPSRDELLAKFLGSIQSPITNFARVIKQIAEKNEEVA